MKARALVAMLALLLALAGCAATTNSGSGDDASLQEVRDAVYRHDGPPKITLYTMINNRNGSGAHTSMMINASQRVIFDPAGSVRFTQVPERGDVLFGVTPTVSKFYTRAHARESFHVVVQEIVVSPSVAELALQLAVQNGAVPAAQCTLSTSRILEQLPGFQSISSTWFPKNLMTQFGKLPGVRTTKIFEDDVDDKAVAIAEFDRMLQAGAAEGQ